MLVNNRTNLKTDGQISFQQILFDIMNLKHGSTTQWCDLSERARAHTHSHTILQILFEMASRKTFKFEKNVIVCYAR